MKQTGIDQEKNHSRLSHETVRNIWEMDRNVGIYHHYPHIDPMKKVV